MKGSFSELQKRRIQLLEQTVEALLEKEKLSQELLDGVVVSINCEPYILRDGKVVKIESS